VAALKQTIARQRVPHAILFVGPSGVGKRTLAQTFARALECTAPDVDARPCGECRTCLLIADGNYPDLRLVETERAGSGQRQDRRDISIEQIRSLQHQVSLKPYEGRWVIGIIAGAHEMSDAAANCLLKTLEEPQAAVVLMLTAPDVGQLFPTIVSRCQVFPLRPLPLAQTEAALVNRFGVEPERAAVLAHLSSGRIGWAVRAAQDESVMLARRERLNALAQAVDSNRRQRLDEAASLSEDYGKGQDGRDAVHETLDLWASWWRDVLLMQEGCAGQITNVDCHAELQRAAASYPSGEAARFLAEILATRDELERNVNARLALEVLLLNLPRRS
jgi:DNA polymerase-3 subunit delta'